ncbi:MAG: glycosyltransferase family 1 protein, partial [Syntrophomonadaceae bacterium]|nr:glycosyltransferase family 1 protein [Syntrophomonadaceae bacterium]
YNPSLVVFDSVDEPSEEFEGWRPYYDKAVRSADVVLATSDKLFELASAINPNVHLVPNGCDYEYFSNLIHGRPAEIADLPGPIIGYIGVVATWVDVDLIARVADSYPDYSVVVVGPLYNVSAVPRRPNLHWLGFKPYEQLAAYVQNFDVGIVPFKSTSMTEAVNPIKMWEYMAAGIPIVTTNMPEAKKYPDVVLASETEKEFIDNIYRAILEDLPEKRARRMALAQLNSWKVRAVLILAIIRERLALKGITTADPIPDMSNTNLPYQSPPEIVAGTSTFYTYTSTGASSYFYAPNRSLKVGRKVAFKFATTPVGRMILQNRKAPMRIGRLAHHRGKSSAPIGRRLLLQSRKTMSRPSRFNTVHVCRNVSVRVVGCGFRFSTGRCVL